MKLTRREVAATLLTAAAASGQSLNPPLAQNAAEELEAAKAGLRQYIEQLARFPLAMSTEPAVHFKA